MIVEISKGQQITLPASIRKKYGWTVGTKLNLEATEGIVTLTAVANKVEKVSQANKWLEADTFPCKLTPKQLKDLIHDEIY